MTTMNFPPYLWSVSSLAIGFATCLGYLRPWHSAPEPTNAERRLAVQEFDAAPLREEIREAKAAIAKLNTMYLDAIDEAYIQDTVYAHRAATVKILNARRERPRWKYRMALAQKSLDEISDPQAATLAADPTTIQALREKCRRKESEVDQMCKQLLDQSPQSGPDISLEHRLLWARDELEDMEATLEVNSAPHN